MIGSLFAQDYQLKHQGFVAAGGVVKNSKLSAQTSLGVNDFGEMHNDRFIIGPATAVAQMEPDAAAPDKFELFQNFPNPFNQSTTLIYELPRSVVVTVEVYSVLGQRLITLAAGRQGPGRYRITYGGLDEANLPLASGLYFCRMKAGHFDKTVKFAIVR